MSRLHHTFQEPEICIDDDALHSWMHSELEDAEKLLTAAIASPLNHGHHVLASRALIRVRLGQWDAAIEDAEQVCTILFLHASALIFLYIKSIKTQTSVIGYIAMFVALFGKGKKQEGYRACDIASEHFHSTHVTILLLIKVCILWDGNMSISSSLIFLGDCSVYGRAA